MKCVPIFFLVGFSVLHLIYVIAVPNAKRDELERLEARKAAAVSRFIKSKRYAPFKSPWKRRHAVLIHLRKYTKYFKAVTKKYLRSAKSRLETQMAGFRENFFRTVGRDLAVLRSYQRPYGGKYWQKQSTALAPVMNRRYQTLFKLTTEGETNEDSARSTFQVTASAYELLRQVAKEVLLRIKSISTRLDADRVFKSLKASELPLVVKTSQTHKKNLRKQAELDELTSWTFVPIPSEVPSLEPTPGLYPGPSARESITPIVEDHGLESSGAPEPSSLGVNGIATLPGSVLPFRRLARFAARI